MSVPQHVASLSPPPEGDVFSAPGASGVETEPSVPLTTPEEQRNRSQSRPPLRFWVTLFELLALGLVGTGLLGVLVGMLGLGIGLLFLLGIGLVVLTGLVYALFCVGWFETARVDALYGLGVPVLRVRHQREPGFGGFVRMLLRQSVDGRMWRSVASFVVASILGVVALGMVQAISWATVSLFAPRGETGYVWPWWSMTLPHEWTILINVLTVLAAVAALWGMVLLHRVITVAIIGAYRLQHQLEAQVQVSAQQREGAVRAADVERTRIERDLHDGVQPRLVSIAMTLGMARNKISTDPDAAQQLVDEAHTSTKSAITELRQLARGIHASVLDDRGLDAALSALGGRSPIPVHLDVRVAAREQGVAVSQKRHDAEAAVYFAIAESLTNAAKHSRATDSRVIVRERADGVLWARVEDNGVGGAQVISGGGIDGIINRVIAAGGTARLESPAGGPTSLEVTVPCAF